MAESKASSKSAKSTKKGKKGAEAPSDTGDDSSSGSSVQRTHQKSTRVSSLHQTSSGQRRPAIRSRKRNSEERVASPSAEQKFCSETKHVSTSVSADDLDDVGQIGYGVGTAAITVDRDEYLQSHRDLTFDRNQQQMKNNILHRRLAEYYKKRKLDHVLKPLENSMDLEEKYQEKLFKYEELKEKEELEVADIRAKVQAVELQYTVRLTHAEEKFDGIQSLEKTTGTGLIYSAKGKPIADKTVQRFLTLQRRKQEQCSALCLRYIRARNAVAELDAIVRKLERLGPGLYVAQYEQLDIDHHNYTTKIEEREDELIKNRAKCTEHNQILAHIREKMHHTDEVIDLAECDLGDAEIEFLTVREDLGQVKNRRDRLRWSLEAERMKAGLLTRKDLLRDFQDGTDKVEKLREKKICLEMQIAKITKELRDARNRMQIQKVPQTGHLA